MRPDYRCGRGLVRQADVAAVGFAVAPPGSETVRLTISRRRNGNWNVIDDSDLRAIPARLRQRAISLSAAVICGANLFGTLVTELEIRDEVRWVGVCTREHQGNRTSREWL